MAKSITIRDVPDDVISVLTDRAAATGISLQSYLRAQLVLMAAKPDADAWVARVRARVERTGNHLGPNETVAHRDADRR